MTKKHHLYKLEAVRLRKTGLSYNEITKKLPVSKGTLSLWLKSIPLSAKDKERLYTKQITNYLARGPSSQKERRDREIEEIVKNAQKEINSPISKETLCLMGATLYWAEGRKGGSFELTNSDPHMVLFFVRWLKEVFKVEATELRLRLNMYPQQNESHIKKFWSELTGIPLENFGKSFVKPANKGYKKNNLYYGTIRIYVCRGTDLKHRLFGWIKAALQTVSLDVVLTQERWCRVLEKPRPVNLDN